MDSRTRLEKDGMIQTLNERMGTGGNNVPLVMRNEEAVDNRISCNSKV
jgi:DNA (cytosine-5)-methyltransferase 1